MNENSGKTFKGLYSKIKKDVIKTMELLSSTKDPEILTQIISKLDDPDIEIRGEAFSCLVLNENKIAKYLIKSLDSPSKNIRSFCCLILANRMDTIAIPHIVPLTKDSSSLVRSCALGALGYLKAVDASDSIHDCFFDSSIEVKKSALKAALDIGEKILPDELELISKETDEDLKKLLEVAKKKLLDGPGGI